MTSTGMSKEMYEHILKNKHLIDIDLDNGVVTTPKGTHGTLCSSTGYLRVKLNKKTLSGTSNYSSVFVR